MVKPEKWPSGKADCDFWTHKDERGKGDNYNNFHVVTVINYGSVTHSGSAAQIIYISLFFFLVNRWKRRAELWLGLSEAFHFQWASYSFQVSLLPFPALPVFTHRYNLYICLRLRVKLIFHTYTLLGQGASSPVLWHSGPALLHHPFPRGKLGQWFPRHGVRLLWMNLSLLLECKLWFMINGSSHLKE